jgi:UDP-glucose 4-epimerase
VKILITGAAGGLGRKMTDKLEDVHELLLTDVQDPAEATVFGGSPPDFRLRAPLSPTWPYLRADLLQTDAFDRFVNDVDVIIHLAAVATGAWDRVEETLRTGVLGTSALLDLARRKGVRRFVNASSINAYGTFFWRVSGLEPVRCSLPVTEDERPVPEDPYSLSKFLSEEVGFAYRRAFGIEVVNLRFASVWHDSRYQQLMTDGLAPTHSLPADLGQWIHVEDVAAGIELAATVEAVTPDPMVLAAEDTRLPEPTLEIIRRFRPDLEPRIKEPLSRRDSLISIARARSRLGYTPRYNLYAAPQKSE